MDKKLAWKSDKKESEYPISPLMHSLQDYSLEPEEELESKLKFFYTNYNEKIQFQKCMQFEHNEAEIK